MSKEERVIQWIKIIAICAAVWWGLEVLKYLKIIAKWILFK